MKGGRTPPTVPVTATASQPATGSSDESRPTVAVVEDERGLREVYARWLDGRYDLRMAANGTEALAVIDESVDVVLLDRMMPDMSGDETLAALDERGYPGRVAMVTAVTPEEDIIEMPFDDYVCKPVSREELVAVIERLLALSAYDAATEELFSLVQKRVALETECLSTELDASDSFAELTARIATLQTEIDEAAEGLTFSHLASTIAAERPSVISD